MHYHIILTQLCDSQCKYCYEKSMNEFDVDSKFTFDFSEPISFSANLEDLKKFISKDKDAVIVFYGGEPLLEIEKIKEIMDLFPGMNFRMQTNGKLLDEVPIEYLKKIGRILVSLDGSKKRTDYNRGAGTYSKVMNNISEIRKKGYNGEIIARMTISTEFPDIYEQVLNLVNNGFDSIHWQLDVGFYKNDYDYEKIKKFISEYNISVSKLLDYWIRESKVIRLYPFVAIAESLLKNEKTKLRCGAGHSGYAITTSGKIVACPIMTCIKDFEAGDLKTDPSKLKKFYVSGRCLECSYLDLCGGRCLYWNKAELWPKEGDDLICLSIKHLIDSIEKRLSDIKSKDVSYEKYFGPEIIP